MADKVNKYFENIEGPYYVDEQCIVCGLCVSTAPNNFTFTKGDKHAYVYKQPENDTEKDSCKEALESCPVDAIGNDG